MNKKIVIISLIICCVMVALFFFYIGSSYIQNNEIIKNNLINYNSKVSHIKNLPTFKIVQTSQAYLKVIDGADSKDYNTTINGSEVCFKSESTLKSEINATTDKGDIKLTKSISSDLKDQYCYSWSDEEYLKMNPTIVNQSESTVQFIEGDLQCNYTQLKFNEKKFVISPEDIFIETPYPDVFKFGSIDNIAKNDTLYQGKYECNKEIKYYQKENYYYFSSENISNSDRVKRRYLNDKDVCSSICINSTIEEIPWYGETRNISVCQEYFEPNCEYELRDFNTLLVNFTGRYNSSSDQIFIDPLFGIIETGTFDNFTSLANTGSINITIPTDADFAMIGISGFESADGYLAPGDYTLNSTTFTLIAYEDVSNLLEHLWVGYIVAPSIGSQVFSWNFGGTSSADYGYNFVFTFFQGVNQTNPIRDFDVSTETGVGGGRDVTGMNNETGDLMVCYANTFGSDTLILTDNGQSLIYYSPVFRSDQIGVAKKNNSGDCFTTGGRYEKVIASVLSFASQEVSDTTPPTYSNNQVNTTIAGESINFSVQYNDDTALHPNGQYIFSTNNTGVWINDSVRNFTTTPETIYNITTLNSTIGLSIGYRWYANDSVGNNNNTEVFVLTTTTADTCTYTSGNWDVTCSDNCTITSNVNLGGNNLTLSNGVGHFNIQANISDFDKIFIFSGCEMRIFPGGGFM